MWCAEPARPGVADLAPPRRLPSPRSPSRPRGWCEHERRARHPQRSPRPRCSPISRPNETAEGIKLLIELARQNGVELRFDSDETAKHELGGLAATEVHVNAEPGKEPDVCIVLGGDGATLRALRAYAGTGVPVFSINYGRVGFLATADRADLGDALQRALTGQFEVVQMPALMLEEGSPSLFAINEVSFQRRSHLNMTHLTYSLAGDEVARVPCDGLIAATPVGSTGYNLSVGGPILAWGVRGIRREPDRPACAQRARRSWRRRRTSWEWSTRAPSRWTW